MRERVPSVGGLRSGRAHSLGVGLALESGEVAQQREGIFISLLALGLDTDRHLLEWGLRLRTGLGVRSHHHY